MKKFFSAIGRFFKDNYWLQPLLLVAVVFALVFSLQGFDDVVSTVKDWISPDSSCSQCENLKAKEAIPLIRDDAKNNDTIYVLIYEDDCEACKEAYPYLNNYLKYHEDIKVYALNITVDEYNEYANQEPKEWDDSSWENEDIGLDAYKDLAESIRVYLTDVGYLSGTTYGSYTMEGPTLLRYEVVNNKYEITSAMLKASDFRDATLKTFFAGDYTPAN